MLILANKADTFNLSSSSMKTVIDRYNKTKEDHNQLANQMSEAKVLLDTKSSSIKYLYPACIYLNNAVWLDFILCYTYKLLTRISGF